MPYSVAPHRANLVLQMLLQANSYVSVVWAMSYLIHLLIRFKILWNLEGLSLMVAYVLAVTAEALRLYAGYSVNLCSGATAMWLLLTVTPCLLLPAMVYLRLSIAKRSLWLRIITNGVFALMVLEVIVSLVHFVICKPNQKRALQLQLEQEQEQEQEQEEDQEDEEEEEVEEEELTEDQPASAVESLTSSEPKRRVRRSPESK